MNQPTIKIIVKNDISSVFFFPVGVIKKSNERLKKISEENPDKIKQYRRTAYLKQKEKKKELENKNIWKK